MKPLFTAFAVIQGIASFSNPAWGQDNPVEPSPRVGRVFIVGNEVTQDCVIRGLVNAYPGQALRYSELRRAERNLARLGIFAVNPGVRPTVTVLESEGEFKDLLVQVHETRT